MVNDQSSTQPTVVVVGGGYGGIRVAKLLDDVASVVLIDPQDAFLHNVATLRALVDPSWLDRIFIPYDGLLARGQVLQDRVVEVDAGRVRTASGAELEADYIVLATGSSYPFPAKSDLDRAADARSRGRAASEALAAADRVLLVGAGAVGIELAGEITSAWPGKRVTLVDLADDVLGEPFAVEVRTDIRAQLDELGVELVLGSALEALPPTAVGELGAFTVRTVEGRELSADIWFSCFGAIPASDYLAGSLAAARRPDGRIEVAPTLQVVGQDRVFAVGDVCAADRKVAHAAMDEADLVVANIRALLDAPDGVEPELGEYTAMPVAIMITLGPERGSGQQLEGTVPWESETVAALKGRHLNVQIFADFLAAGEPEPPA